MLRRCLLAAPLAFATAFAGLPVVNAHADADVLLSDHRPATASSEAGPGSVAGRAVDGDPRSGWRSVQGDRYQWISVDLGAISTVSRVSLRWSRACARAYRVQLSPDGVVWNDAYSTRSGHQSEDLSITGAGRFVRVYASAPCLPNAPYSLTDLQVYGHSGVTDVRPPTPPADLHTTATTSTSIALAWNASKDDVAVTAYDVYQQGQLVKTVDATSRSTTMSKLAPTTSYDFFVKARDAAGNTSAASPTITAATKPVDTEPPTTPTNVRVTRTTANSITLTWSPSTDNDVVTSYTVLTGTTQATTSTTPSATIYGLPPTSSHTYTVKATDASGNASQLSPPVTAATRPGADPVGEVKQIATDTDIPWGMAFLPDGSALTTERDAHTVVRVTPSGQRTTVGTVPNVAGTDGEGGLLGLELSPHFKSDHWLYLFHTSPTDNRIVRIKYENNALDLSTEQVLLAGIARNKFHNGGRLRFGPDGKLYAATGDAQNGANAQDLNSLNGKILRLNPDGSIPADNPFPGKYVWSYGHRNIEGLAFDSRGRLWEAELGNSITDELNLIHRGGNHGWPACEGTTGDCSDPTFIKPIQTWPVADASPSGLAIVNDHLYMGALRGLRLWRMKITGNTTTTPQPYFTGTYGRIRTVEPSPDNGLWLTTSSGDKDSTPDNSTDQLLHLSLSRR